MAVRISVLPRSHPVTLGFDPYVTYPKGHRLITGPESSVQTSAGRSACATVACWIFCCTCFRGCESNPVKQIVAIDRFKAYLHTNYGRDVTSLAESFLSISFFHAYRQRCMYTEDASLLFKCARLIQNYGTATFRLLQNRIANKVVHFSLLEVEALLTKGTCDIEFVASLFRVYDLFMKLSKDVSIKIIGQQIAERISMESLPISNAAMKVYFEKLEKTYLITGDYESLSKAFADAAPTSIFEFELSLATTLHKMNYKFTDSTISKFRPFSKFPQKLNDEDWQTVTTIPASKWDIELLKKIHTHFQTSEDRKRSRRIYEELGKTTDLPSATFTIHIDTPPT